jgi:hypothetical protein
MSRISRVCDPSNSSEKSPTDKPKSRKVREGIAIGVGTLVGSAIVPLGLLVPEVVKATHQPNDRLSQFMFGALHESVLIRTATVSCVPQKDLEKGPKYHGIGETTITGKGRFSVYSIRLSNPQCKAVVRYARQSDKGSSTVAERTGLFVAVHESEHVDNEEGASEADTQCVAFQKLPEFAEELGATHQEALDLQRKTVGMYFHDYPTDYRTNECYDGGPLDIDLHHHGIFPYTR